MTDQEETLIEPTEENLISLKKLMKIANLNLKLDRILKKMT